MKLGNLVLIKISSPRANVPFEPNNVKISSKLTELPALEGAFFTIKCCYTIYIYCTSSFCEKKTPSKARHSTNLKIFLTFLGSKGPLAQGENIFISARLSNSIKIRPFWGKNLKKSASRLFKKTYQHFFLKKRPLNACNLVNFQDI